MTKLKQKKTQFIGNIVLLVLAILVSECSRPSNDKEEFEGLPYYNSAEYTPEWIAVDSVKYQGIHTISDFDFVNQHGKKVSLDTFQGKLIIANFFFSICPGICPKMMGNMHLLQKEYVDNEGIVLLSHSVTPWIDSVSRLKDIRY